ncbi:MAG: polysaccharide deacetylase family protein [Azospirillaceae bacterium]|nr:polysaccharide deacetylase family protein [Azospirillaceae bacterium]
MPLPDDYLVYPKRRLGPDHERYDASPVRDRAPLVLPDGAKVALWVNVLLEFFPLNPSGKPFKAPGAMQTPYPDLRHYTTRDYGNRVGVYRILKVLDRLGIPATFWAQGAVAERYPTLIRDIQAAGHEIGAHGWDTDTIHHTAMDEGAERKAIADTLATLKDVTGTAPQGWLSPARAEGFATPDRLKEGGVEWFADWAHDELPTAFRTTAGDLTAMPLSDMLDDWQILVTYRRPEEEWVAQVADSADWLVDEADRFGGRVLSLTLRPHISGQAYRIRPLADSLEQALARPGVRAMTGGAILDAWRK